MTMLKSLVTLSRVTAAGPHGKIALALTNAVKKKNLKKDQDFEEKKKKSRKKKKKKKRSKMNRPGR